jgi:Viral BACON domain
LIAGTYQGNITVTGPSGAVTITAIVTVTPPSTTGALVATPSALAFNTVAGGKVRSKQTVKLNSTATTFTAVSNQPWLQVNPASGTTGTNNLTVTVETVGMKAGSYLGMITITPTGTGVSGVLSIPVTLTIIGPHHHHQPSRRAEFHLGEKA